ncbi:39S ribosomal protein L22, mitochondrial [Lingula anatina]|uniref:Large ribosomal subunit protein uL22m n=1 Tax=Lingula anatina TaxID=7574 RepID=A0A1S3J631_LINAN|nr:39S ribosomal protein L22, mitochondrial [Lingula anatina]|eukprot:XP_013405850.1 39S ribosomal protein L22, mitochondrial [Lingula anatina]
MTSVISRIRPATSLFSRHLALSRSAAAGNSVLQTSYFHTSDQQHAKMKTIMKQAKDPPYYKRMNEIVYPPQKEGELRRPAEINHWRMRIKYSPDKMWYIACLIRGMSIDDALKQLTFYKREGGQIVKDVLLEAQEKAVKEHNVEYKSNLWVGKYTEERCDFQVFAVTLLVLAQ